MEQHFVLEEDPTFWLDNNVQVLIRVRPMNSNEMASQDGSNKCLRQESPHTLTWVGQPEIPFTFDHVAGEAISQESLFNVVGLPMVENCMGGYNSCMLAYGQTGSGKSHTMLGEIKDFSDRPSENRGMTPRVFESMFSRIKVEEAERENEKLKFSTTCSFLEIYNEQVIDLLEPTSRNLQIQEDVRKGVSVANLKKVVVNSAEDVISLLSKGSVNRKVAAPNMNRESSRSHSVFTCTIESRWERDSMTNTRFGRLSLVDLAGCESVKRSGAEGERQKEAGNINNSLITLGLVFEKLVMKNRQLHIPYRSSKLTHLLQDYLGGNSKIIIIATVSPLSCNALETLSTLKFVQRAKCIRNKAVRNDASSLDKEALWEQLQQKELELEGLRSRSFQAGVFPESHSIDKKRLVREKVFGLKLKLEQIHRCSLKVSRSQEDDLLAGFANLLDQHLEVLDGEIAVDQELIARATPTTEEIASAPELNVAACKRDLRQLEADKHPSEVNAKRSKLRSSLDTRVEEFENKVDEECEWLWDNWDVERRREANVTPIDSMSFRFSLDWSRDCQLDPPLISSPDDPSLLSFKDPLCISNREDLSFISNPEDLPCISSPEDLPFISNPEDLPCISSPEDVPFISNPEDLRCSSSAEDVPCISSAQEMIENSPLLLPVEEALKIKRKGGLFNEEQRKVVYLETVKYINHKRFPWKQILESLQNQRELDFGNVNPKQIRDCFGNINRKLNR